MPRPRKERCCRQYQADRIFKPRGVPPTDITTSFIALDEFEALRLCDSEGLHQEEAARRMKVSRGTIQRLVTSARKTIVDAIFNNHAIIVNLRRRER